MVWDSNQEFSLQKSLGLLEIQYMHCISNIFKENMGSTSWNLSKDNDKYFLIKAFEKILHGTVVEVQA